MNCWNELFAVVVEGIMKLDVAAGKKGLNELSRELWESEFGHSLSHKLLL